MPLEVTSNIFSMEWKACWEDSDRDVTQLLNMIQPFLDHWKALLTNIAYPRDIHYSTLCQLFGKNVEEAVGIIKGWVRYAENTTSVMEELQMLFLERLRRLKYFPNRASHIMAEYVIARDFKYNLMHKISTVLGQNGSEVEYQLNPEDPDEICVEYNHPDYILIKGLDFNLWESYIFTLLKMGTTTSDTSRLTRIPRVSMLRQEQKIWQSLETKQFDS